MPLKTKEEMIACVERLATQVAEAAGLELFEVELKGSGRSHYLRVYLDKPLDNPEAASAEPGELPPGVTHDDCERVSRELSELLDKEDPIPGTYSLEVSSPGVERPLKRFKDWTRFTGQPAKVSLREPVADGKLKSFEGVITGTDEADQTITVDLGRNRSVTFPVDLVSKANLKFEW